MADDDELKPIEVESTKDVSLLLHIGGSFPYKSMLFEYPSGGGEPLPRGGEQAGTAPVSIGLVGKGVVRRFAWSVAVVSDDEIEQIVEIVGHVQIASRTVGTVKGKLAVARPIKKCFVNVHVKGKGV